MQRFSLRVRHMLPFALFCIAAFLIGAGATLAQSYKVAVSVSQALTSYLRQNRLPLVGAQVLADGAGRRHIVLYGFVATQVGKNDAAQKAVAFLKNRAEAGTSEPQVDNRIEIRPEIARMKMPQAAAASADSGNKSLDQVLDEIDRYGVKMVPPLSNAP